MDGGNDSGAPGSESLGRRSARGAMWAIGGSLVAEPIRILGTAVLARLLTPADFGLIGMAAVFFGLTAITTELGPSAAIIRKRDLTHTETSSLFWLCTAVGLLLAVLAVLAAPLIARLYRDPSVGPVFAVLSLTILLSAEALVPNALLRRRMDFRIPAFANVSSVVVNAAVAIACALAGLGYWSLVVGTLAGVLTSVAVVGVGARFMPQLRVRRADVAPSAAFSTQVTGAEVANYAATNIDNLLVGRLLGSAALGIYALAYNLVTYPVRMFSSLVAQATLPALCRMADERQRMREAYVRALRLSSAVVLPALTIALVLAPQLVIGIYGEQWAEAIVPFQLLCLAGIARSIGVFARAAFKALGLPERQLRWDLILLAGVAAGAVAGSRWGVAGVAVGVAAATGVASLGAQLSVDRALELRGALVVRALGPSLALMAGAGITALAIAAALGSMSEPPLVIAAVAGIVASALTWAWGRRAFADIRDLETLASSVLRGRRASSSTDSPSPPASDSETRAAVGFGLDEPF